MLCGRLISYGLITGERILSPVGEKTCERSSFESLKREDVFTQPHLAFGKLAQVEKLAFGAAALALEAAPTLYTPETTGIVLSTSQGSLQRDLEYMQSVHDHFPRPALFQATLPSSPIAEIAILFQLKGPNRVVMSSTNQDFTVLENALLLLRTCPTLLVVSVDESPQGYAAALLLQCCLPEEATLLLSSSYEEYQGISPLLPLLIDQWHSKTDFIDITPHYS